ncbi:hypothetical protein FS749_007064 [Ceratobasidium sp. UAMH 11750]|nr:hypothetical protein FS749_007064 [Ceratobasidium sp. UAMH 11750]
MECTRQSSLRYDNARRVLELDKEYKDQAVVVIEELLIAGALRQQDVDPPEVYDEIIPTLRSVHKDNGLEYIATLRTYRYDGGPVEHAPVQNLHVTTHKGAYRGKLVEIKEYFGGPEGELLQNIQELVEHHQTFDDNANLARLYGGFVRRLPDGKLCTHLVFTPTKGEPWVEVAKAKLSVELLCQVAEGTMDLFDYLKTKRQMNWDSIKIGPDGTLCMDLTTQGDNFLLTEQIWDPIKDHERVPWPIKELFELFQEADRQGITRDAIAALRAHTGPWDQIAVWKVAKQIGLRPAENSLSWRAMYPPRDWQIHAGMIVAWLGDEDVEEFDQLDMMPEQGLCWFNQKHLRQFLMLNAHGETGDRTLASYRREENWFKCMPGGEWE